MILFLQMIYHKIVTSIVAVKSNEKVALQNYNQTIQHLILFVK